MKPYKLCSLALLSMLAIGCESEVGSTRPDRTRYIYVISPVTGRTIYKSKIRGAVKADAVNRFYSWVDNDGNGHDHTVDGDQLIHISDAEIIDFERPF